MLEDLDEEDAKKIKYVVLAGIGMIIFLSVLLWLMDVIMPAKKKKTKNGLRANVTLQRDFRF